MSFKPTRRAVLAATLQSLTLAALSARAAAPIRMAFNSTFAPFSYRVGTSALTGIFIDLMNRLSAETGEAFAYEDFPWARAQSMVKAGQLDGVCTIATAERRDYIDFTPTPLLEEPTVIVYRKDDARLDSVRTLEDLRAMTDLKIGAPLGSGWIKPFLGDRDVASVPDVANLMPMIESSRLDVSLLGLWSARVAVERFDSLAVRLLDGDPGAWAVRFGLRKTYPRCAAILAAADSAIQKMRAEGQVEHIVARYMP